MAVLPLPASLQAVAKKPPASAITEIVDQFRSSNTPFSRASADALERTHDHLDGLTDSFVELVNYVGSASSTDDGFQLEYLEG